MKHIVSFVLFLISMPLIADNYVRVQGVGDTPKKIKDSALRLAIETNCGVSINSNKKFRNYFTAKNELFYYSSCFVSKYKQVDEITFDVWLKDNRISSRILGSGETFNTLDGLMLSDQINTFKDERSKGDIFLNSVMSDYPMKGYNLLQNPSYISYDGRRNIWLNIPYSLNWNPNFIIAMMDTIELFNVKHGKIYSEVILQLGKKNIRYGFDDMQKNELLVNSMTGNNELRIIVRLIDNQGNSIRNYCYKPHPQKGMFFDYDFNTLKIYFNDVNSDTIQIPINFSIENLVEVELEVLNQKDCLKELPKYK